MRSLRVRVLASIALLVLAVGCGTAPGDPRGDQQTDGRPVLSISAIPDQDPHLLQRLYRSLSDYLSDEVGVQVRYIPVTDYAASVTAYTRGDLQLVFFGGLTGVQARAKVPGSLPIAQRDVDAEFRSVFITNTASDLSPIRTVAGLTTLAGHSFTFGSESSTSGRLMPQHFLAEAGVHLDDLAGKPGFSGSHDATAKLVESGTYQVGVLSAAVWDDRVSAGSIDTGKVREIFRTPTYHDYHWLARPDLDERFGAGFTKRLTETVLGIDGSDDTEKRILDMFSAKGFIPTDPGNYRQIEAVAKTIGMLPSEGGG
ncbi:MAG: putative selenate ABC transporter substrate-binding protein [Haloechinothrix sp.]